MPRKKYKVNVAEGERVSPNAVYDYLIQKGVPHNHALGMMANIRHESNFIPTAKGDSGTSAGLFQHHNERYSGLKKHVNNDLRNWKGQIDYALNEGDTKSFLKKDFKSPEQASHWFTTKWERPQDAGKKAVQRQGWIKTYLDNRGQDYNQNLYNPENIDPFEEDGPVAYNEGSSEGVYGYMIPEDEKRRAAFKKDLAVTQEEESKVGESEARQELTEEEKIKQKKESFIEELASLSPKRSEEIDTQEESTQMQPGKVYLGDESKLFQPIQAAQQQYAIQQARDGGYFGDDDTEEYRDGGTTGIPDRYKKLGFTKVGEKKKSSNPDKKWMVLAKKGDQYKVVHGGDPKMQDFSQHKDPVRRKAFWDRMGGINGPDTKDPFSPKFWHKRFGTW
jgi:hypothetical protein